MSFWARLKFLFGILIVILSVGLLILYLNNAMSTVHAKRAELGADTTTVGVDFPGLVKTQNVTEGDKVSKGETLFVINSPQLSSTLTNRTPTSSLPFSINYLTNDISLKAAASGVVEKVDYQAGSYVPGGTVVATIDTTDTLYVSAHFQLTPPDYARVKKGNRMDVTFPDNGTSSAIVYSISLTPNGNAVDTVVKARLQGANLNDFRFPIGTPVEASMKLSQRMWYQDVTDFLHKLFKPSGQ